MAEFNIQLPDTGVPNMTGASKGTGPNRTFDTIFSGLTQAAGDVIQAKDTATQIQIRDDAQGIFEATNKEFGVAAPEAPEGMASEMDRISVLQDALSQGKISQTNYYGRLATLTKQLRAKYPRYEQIVDQTIQSVTGTRPANAYRDALFSEMQSLQAGASDEQKFRRQYEKENEGVLAAIYGDDYFQNPDAYDFAETRSKVSAFKGKSELIAAEKEELSLMTSRGEFNEKRASKAINRDFSFVVESTLTKGLNLNSPTGMSKISEFIQKGGGTPQELDEFVTNVTGLESSLRNTLVEKGRREYVQTGIMTFEQVNKAVDEALYPIRKAKEAVLGGDFKLASRYATINKTIQDQQLNEMLERSPELRAGMGLTEVNDALGAEFLQRHQTEIADVALEVAGRAMVGNEDAVDLAVKSGNNKVARGVIDSSFDAITDPKLTGEKFDNLVSQFFAGKTDFMSSDVVAAEDLERVYTRFLSPDVTRAIFSKGSPDTKRRYTEWALDKAQAIPAFRAAAGDLKNVASLDNLEVRFDPESFAIQLFNKDGRVDNGYYYGRTTNAVNKVMTVLKPIFEAQGGDVNAQAERFFQNLGGTLGEPAQGGIFSRIGQALRETGLGKGIGETSGREPGSTILPFAAPDFGGSDLLAPIGQGRETPVFEEDLEGTDELDFVVNSALETGGRRTSPSTVGDEKTRNLLDMIGQAEGAGYNTLFGYNEGRYGITPTDMTLSEVLDVQKTAGKDLGSSAIGKYQIIRKTLNSAIREMGLPLDTKFTPEVQDAIAQHLLERRGYSRYRSGEISSKSFLNNLAKEWASVPTATGASFYAGDSMGNKASRGGRAIARFLRESDQDLEA